MTKARTDPSPEAAPRLRLFATMPVEILAAADAKDGDKPVRPRFTISGYTGAPMSVSGFYSPVIVDLTGLRAASQEVPVLWDHDTSRIVGMTDAVKIGAAGVQMGGIVTGDNVHASEIVSQAKNGFKWQASIGAGIDRREFLDAGKVATVNGREVHGPMIIAREATIYEISFVAIGADGSTSASVAAAQSLGSSTKEASIMFDQWLEAKGFDPAALSDSQKNALKAAYDAEREPSAAGAVATKPAPTPSPVQGAETLEAITARRRAEENRVQAITLLASKSMDDRPSLVDEIEKMARAAIASRDVTPEQFELELLRATRASASHPGVVRGKDAKFGSRMIEAALCVGGGLPDVGKFFDEQTLNSAHERFSHGLGLRDLLVIAARENGYTGTTSSDVRGLMRAAFGRLDVRAEGFSTISLPGILSNVANKFLIQGFTSVEEGWRDIARVRSVRDFKQTTSYTLSGAFGYEKMGPGGELKHATPTETSYTNRAETYGKMFAITRQDLINDDLGALTEVPMRLGRGAATKFNEVFWTEFLAGVTAFFATGNGNVISGAGSVLQSSSLKSALEKFRKQTDPDGKPLGVTPRLLLVPPELEITADELMTSTQVNTGGAATATQVMNRNVWMSKFKTVMSSYLSNSAITNYSATHWFLIADPMDLAVIEVAFLNGRETPIVESADADFDTLGIQMRGYHDFGVSKQEYRAGVRSVGA